MPYREPARTTTRPIPTVLVAGLLVVIAAIAALLAVSGYPFLSSAPSAASSSPSVSSSPPVSSSSTAASPIPVLRREGRAALDEADGNVPGGPMALRREDRGALGEADGAVPDGTTVFDDEIPGVAKLNSDLLGALRRAAADAAGDGVSFYVESGWRSRAYQERLLCEAISKYGSEEQATRWVATPHTSAHVSGNAVDIGPSGAAAWLSERGAAYGLCRIYRNEPWHDELRPEAIDHGCPAMYADPTQDPRTQR
jgi:zinc D-Ala-D-Ala carboxypeptidase